MDHIPACAAAIVHVQEESDTTSMLRSLNIITDLSKCPTSTNSPAADLNC
jgi:hypothetical protein